MELKGLQNEPVEGFRVKLLNEDNLFQWQVAIFGPPGTLYEGGYFKAIMDFPKDYPFSPPSLRFVSKLWHPNVYENGDVCISILHPPADDPQSGELPNERWNPTQNVGAILLSVISLLNEPNTFSPANVDASVMFRRWKESSGKDNDYERIVKKQVVDTGEDAKRDGVVVPTTIDEYIIKAKPKPVERDEDLLMEFGHDCGPMDDEDDCYGDDDDDDDGGDDDDNNDIEAEIDSPVPEPSKTPEQHKPESSEPLSDPSPARQQRPGATTDDSGSEMS